MRKNWFQNAVLTAFFILAIFAPNTFISSTASAQSTIATIKKDIPYGPDNAQRFDVYLPENPKNAPVIFMVHGGAWFWGDKTKKQVVANKVSYWLPKGYIFISTNYRLLPRVNPLEQAHDVATALAKAQSLASTWGGDPKQFTIMGHSAGAHLVALLAVKPSIAISRGAKLWKSAVLIDTAALDVPKVMAQHRFRIYNRAFGKDPKLWRAISPIHHIKVKAPPILLICSTLRARSCPVGKTFAKVARKAGTFITVYPVPLSHRKLNTNLGIKGRYTSAVANFIK